MNESVAPSAPDRAQAIRAALPAGGLFAGQDWRTSPAPFPLGEALAKDLDSLGRVLLQFYRAANLLYRRSYEGKSPAWIAELLDQGKPGELIALQRHPSFKNDVPRVIRPDVLLTEDGFVIAELDSVPGGIGLTQWLNQTYEAVQGNLPDPQTTGVLGGSSGMREGFASIFGDAARVHLVISDESASYRPEMEWLTQQPGGERYAVRDSKFTDFAPGDAIYRFFELFDLANVPNSKRIFELAMEKQVRVTPAPKPLFEEKLLFALLWNRNLRPFWRQELGEAFLARLLRVIPQTWVLDPAPLPPHAAYPGLDLTDWTQLKALSQRDRELILKVSGYNEEAWGARGVYLGSDLSTADWSVAVDKALSEFPRSPHVLQRFHRPRVVDSSYFDFATNQLVPMPGRVRLCPYYFVSGEGDAARPKLGGALATIVPADKKIVHGMRDAILAPCSV
ncbi:MAG TPA: hypothetical protein VMB21_17170 [Candidatus Limnocylindria bacterium]|nr:hypothetical protein [Candidatus Limnocylindria bacterium]